MYKLHSNNFSHSQIAESRDDGKCHKIKNNKKMQEKNFKKQFVKIIFVIPERWERGKGL